MTFNWELAIHKGSKYRKYGHLERGWYKYGGVGCGRMYVLGVVTPYESYAVSNTGPEHAISYGPHLADGARLPELLDQRHAG